MRFTLQPNYQSVRATNVALQTVKKKRQSVFKFEKQLRLLLCAVAALVSTIFEMFAYGILNILRALKNCDILQSN